MGPVVADVLAVDGGNSKTDVALVAADGRLLGYARGPGSCHQSIGIRATMQVLDRLVREALAETGTVGRLPVARKASVYLAGADLPVEVEMLHRRVQTIGWAADVTVDNDTFALLRAGTEFPDRVAVVCGAGINCVGVAADGRTVRFPSLGRISGDWGGGSDLGTEALYLAVRAEDGRGKRTALQQAVPAHFERARAVDVTAAIHLGDLPSQRLHELTPLLFQVANAGDDVARAVVARLADEVAGMAIAALRRLQLLDVRADVVLGGGVLAARDPDLLRAVEQRVLEDAPEARLRVVDDPPVVGAALLGLDSIGASDVAEAGLRTSLLERVAGLRSVAPTGAS